jgi:hypothetical protein
MLFVIDLARALKVFYLCSEGIILDISIKKRVFIDAQTKWEKTSGRINEEGGCI